MTKHSPDRQPTRQESGNIGSNLSALVNRIDWSITEKMVNFFKRGERGVKTATIVGAAGLALAGCAPQGEAEPQQTDGTSQASESPSATPSEAKSTQSETESGDTISVPGYSEEQIRYYETIVNLSLKDFYALPRKTQLEALYALYLHNPDGRNVEDPRDLAISIVGGLDAPINGIDNSELLPFSLRLDQYSPAQQIGLQSHALTSLPKATKNAILRGYNTNVPDDLPKKSLVLGYVINSDGTCNDSGCNSEVQQVITDVNSQSEVQKTYPIYEFSATLKSRNSNTVTTDEIYDGEDDRQITYIGTAIDTPDGVQTIYAISAIKNTEKAA